MAVLYLVRHGQASFGARDYDALSDTGRQQSALLGTQLQKLCSAPPLAISGSMQRHQQTLEEAEKQCRFTAHYAQPGWNEYDHEGILAASDPQLSSADSIKAWLETQPEPKMAFARAFSDAIRKWQASEGMGYQESWPEFQARVWQSFEEALSRLSEGQDIVVFSSGGPVSWVLNRLLHAEQSRWLNMNWTLVNAGYHKIINSAFGPFVSSMNEHSYLQVAGKQLITYK